MTSIQGQSPLARSHIWPGEHKVAGVAQLFANAAFSASRRAESVNGLNRHSVAPSFNRRERTEALLDAVIKMMGIPCFLRANSSCISGPLMPGIAMSRIRHCVLFK